MKKIIFILCIVFLMTLFLIVFHKPATLQDRAPIPAASNPRVSPEWKSTPVRLGANDDGWEDSLYVTPDGARIYFAYYPGDLINDARKGSFKDDIDIYFSDYPFITKQKETRFNLSEDIWSATGPQVTVRGDFFYTSNSDYLRDQKSDADIYLNGERLPFNDALGPDQEFGNPHYCASHDELWIDEQDTRMWVLKNAQANGFAGKPELAPTDALPFFQPWLSEDCQVLYFSSNRGDVPGKGPAIYTSQRTDDAWGTPVPVVSNDVGVGEPTLTGDGKKLFFIQLFKNDRGEFTSDMFYVERKDV